MNSSICLRCISSLIAAFLLVVQSSLPAQVLWEGSNNDSWNNAANWAGSNLPLATEYVQFNTGSTFYPVTLGQDQTIAGIIFNNTSPLSIGGNEAFTLTLAHQANPAIDVIGSSSVNLLSDLQLSGSGTQSWNNISGAIFTASGKISLQTNLALSGNNNSSFILGSAGNTFTNSGASRTITVQDTGAATELTIQSNIVLSEHASSGRTLTFDVATGADVVINGNTSNGSTGASNLRTLGAGNVTFNGNLTHTGYTSVEGGGQLVFNSGYTGSELRVINGSVTFNGTSATIRGMQIGGTSATNVSLNFASGFTLNLTNDVFLNNTTSPVTLSPTTINLNAPRVFTVAKNNTLIITSDITTATPEISARIHKAGEGTMILQGSSTYDGSNNAITAGTLVLDFSNNTDAKLSNQDLTIYNSTLAIKGNSSSDVVQQMKNLRIASGSDYITAKNEVILESVNGKNVTLAIQSLNRDSNGGTIHFVIPEHTSVTTSLSDRAIHAAWATMNDGQQDHFIAVQGGRLVAATSSVNNDDIGRNWSPTLVNANVTDEAGFAGTSDEMKVSSIRFTSDALINVVNRLHIESGGILVTESSTASGIHGGILTVGETNDELIVHQNSSTAFEISSNIYNQKDFTTEGVNITKTGVGELILSGENRTSSLTSRFGNSGRINIYEGTLTVANSKAIGPRSTINLSSSSPTTFKLQANVTTSSITSASNNSTIDIGNHTLTIKQLGNTQYNGAIVGSGTIIKENLNPANSDNWTLSGTSNNNFTGHLIVNGGNVVLSGNGVQNLNAITSITINQNGGLVIDNNGATGGNGPNYTESSRIKDTATVVLNGANTRSASTGGILGFIHRSNSNSVHGELIANLNVNASSNYVVLEATATSSTGTSNNAVLIRATNGIDRDNHATLTIIGSNLAGASNSRTRLQMSDSNSNTASVAFANQFRTGAYANGSTAAATVNTQENHTGTSLSIVPWAIGQNITGAATATTLGNSFVHFESDLHGFRALRLDTEYAAYAATASHVNGNNVRETSTTDINLSETGGKTVNSLAINNQNDSATAITVTGSGILSNTSGAFLFTGTGAVDANGRANANAIQGGITLTGFDGIEVTGPNKEYHIFVTNTSVAGVTVESAFTTSGAALVKSGTGLLRLTGDNSAVDTVVINEGILEVKNRNSLGGTTGTLILAGGALQLSKEWMATEQDLTGYTISALDGTISRINTNGNTGAAGADAPDARLTLGPLGPGNGTIIKEGNGQLTLTGNTATQHTGDFYVYNTGNGGGAANGNITQLVLNNTGGNAIGGNLFLGSPDSATAQGGAVVVNEADEQIADTAIVTFYGNNSNGGNRGYWNLKGHYETVAGIVDTEGHGVIQNNLNGTTGVLIVTGSGDYLFSGYLRNQAGSLSFTKDGTGTQTLRGDQIAYTGDTYINDGRLILTNTTNFNSNVLNNSEIEIERTSGTWTMNKGIAGDGDFYKTGDGTVVLNNTYEYWGQTNIEAGTLSLGESATLDNTSSINIKHGATFNVFAKGEPGYTYNNSVSGNGKVVGNLTLGFGGSIRPGASSTPVASTGDLLGSMTIEGKFTLGNGGSVQMQLAGATLNDISGVLGSYSAGTTAFSEYLTSKIGEWDDALHYDSNGVPNHDYISIAGEFNWNKGGTISFLALNYTPSAGDILNLWNWDFITGDYDLGVDSNFQREGGQIGDLELPNIAGVIYDLTFFESHGIIVVVPEPSRCVLFLVALLPVVLRRRR